MPTDLSNMVEPVADPTAKPTKKTKAVAASPALADLPQSDIVPEKPKVSPRSMWEVKIAIGSKSYGPFQQEAVDESEAIQRVIDTQAPQLRSEMVSARTQVTPIANAA